MGKLADSLMKEAKEKKDQPKQEDAAPALNPPAPGNPFQTVQEATGQKPAAEQPKPAEAPAAEPKAEKKSKLAASVAAEPKTEPAATKAAEPKPEPKPAASGAGFNLYVGCEPVKGTKRDTVLVVDLVHQATEVLRTNFTKAGKDWNEALRFGEVQKRVADLIAQTVDNDPSILGGKNVRAPLQGFAADVAVNVLAARATAYIQASAL